MASSVLSAPLPERWGMRQRLKNTLIYGALRGLAAVLRRMPEALTAPLSQVLGTGAYVFDRRDRQRARAQVSQALPHVQPKRVTRQAFVHLARSALEMAHLPRLLQQTPLTTAQRQLLDAAYAEGRGVVAVSGHIGNWELLAQVLAHAGYPVCGIAKPLYDPRLTRWVDEERRKSGLHLIWRGDKGVGQRIQKIFSDNHMLAFFIDQDTRVDGAFVPFFDRPAYTPTAAAALALRAQAPIIVGWTHRDAHGKHQVHLERLPYSPEDTSQSAVTRLTAQLTQRLEAAIRMQPTQWVWMHARWKRQPIET